MDIFESLESEVRSYCRSFPTVFTRAENHRLWDDRDREYIDFLAGAGALNYGHNPPAMRDRVIDYLKSNGVVHSLDMKTPAKAAFLERFRKTILEPRGLDYKVMFPGPTGTNAVEAALKLARKVTRRETVIGFTNAFHGMTLGSLSVTGNAFKRLGAGLPLTNSVPMPFCGYMGADVDTIDYIERMLEDPGSGLDEPAAFIVETVQGEGGINTADYDWLKRLAELCKTHGALLIVDDIQAGCGRTGTFFSFEPAGITPDIVTLSKSIGGMGLPMAVTLFRRELDLWEPGEHNGTFRGHNLAFVAAHEALSYWEDDAFAKAIAAKAERARAALDRIAAAHPEGEPQVRGRGLFQGIAWGAEGLAEAICAEAFERGLIVETSGPSDDVVKVMPPLTIDEDGLRKGLDILADAAEAACVARFGDAGARDAA